VTPNLATAAGSDVLLGNNVTDSATLTNLATKPASPVINTTGAAGAVAGGTITFTLYGPGNCSTVAYTSSATAISTTGSTGTASATFKPTATGTYHWVASYSGDSPNNNATTHNTACDDTDEDVVVTSVPSSMTTAQTWVPNDSATISASAGGDLAGKVFFTLYPTSNCTGAPVYSTPAAGVAVSGSSPQTVSSSNTTAVSATGNYSWSVSYDSTNLSQDDIAAGCHETSSVTINNNVP
jgi:hypothetical protein